MSSDGQLCSVVHLFFLPFFTFIKTSPIAVFTAPRPSFIHYSFLSWQAIRTARQPVHYAHMKPITPTGLANSSNIYLLPCEQRVNLPVTPKPSQPLWNKNITFPTPETALMLNLPSLTFKQSLKSHRKISQTMESAVMRC